MLPADARHIARWDPQAVLRLVAAMRKIVEMYQTATDGRTASARTRDLDLASAMGRKVALGNVIELLIAAMEPSNE
jgi:ABC-type Fe2+-enterobactin transport system substrate-binding protein